MYYVYSASHFICIFEVVGANPFLFVTDCWIYLFTNPRSQDLHEGVTANKINGFPKKIFSQLYCLQNNNFSKIEHCAR